MLTTITIIQPFAHLVAAGAKRAENRTWPTTFRGPLAVHAGKADRYGDHRVVDLAADYGVAPRDLAYGAIVAVVELAACVRIAVAPVGDARRRQSIDALGSDLAWMHGHEHAEGPWCHVYRMLWRPPEPIACRGGQKLWTVPADVEATVREAWYAERASRARGGA